MFGLDLNPDFLRLAASHSQAALIEGDAYQLPFATGTFAMVYCHYFLLWLTGKEFVLKEIFRILQPGGVFLVLAEPDHFGRIDYPKKLAELGRLQTQALTAQGIDPAAGRKVAALLHQAGFDQVMTGVIGSEWRQQPDLKQLASEWRILRYDLRDRLSAEQLAQLQHLDEQAWQAGMRILYVPTFFARANKPVGRTNPAY